MEVRSPLDRTRSSSGLSRQDGLRMPPFFKKMLKFGQLDFELAIWEMTNLLFAPKKVFRSMYYNQQTRNTWHHADPSFTYLLSLFMLLTGLAWGLATAPTMGGVIRLTILYVLIHFLGSSLAIATAAYFFIGKVLGRGIPGLPGRRRRGLFGGDGAEQLEFGYCFDVSIRAFFPVWLMLYVLQYVLWQLIASRYWASLFFGNTLYLVAVGYYWTVTFLGYNALPFLSHTQLLLTPIGVSVVLWIVSLIGYNIPRHIGPIFKIGAG